MYIETYLAVNLLADVALIGAVSRALGLFNRRRVLVAGTLCALYAALAASRPTPWASASVQIILLALSSGLICGRAGSRLCGTMALSLCAASLLGSGIARLLSLSGVYAALPGAAAGGLTVCAMFAAHPPRCAGYQVDVSLLIEGRTARFTALVDTGNRLREPISGLPVLIAETGLLRGRLPERGYRVLRYGAVGGEGSMACFKPSAVWIGHGRSRRRVPDIWIALAPKRLPGAFRALAPSDFSLYM